MPYAGWGGTNQGGDVRTAYSGWGKEPYQESWKSIRTKRNLESSKSALNAALMQEDAANRNLALWQSIADGSMIKQLGKDIAGTTAAVGRDLGNVLTPWKAPAKSVTVFGQQYPTPSAKGEAAGKLFAQGEYKKGFGELGSAGLDVASTFAGPAKLFKFLKQGSAVRNFLEGGTTAGTIGFGYGATEAMKEGKDAGEITKSGLTTGAAAFLGGGFLSVIPGAVSSVAKGIKQKGFDGLRPEVAKVLTPEAPSKPAPVKSNVQKDFEKSLTEAKGMYSVDEKPKLYKDVIEPKIKALGDVGDDETVVMFQGDGKKGQYVNTKPSEVWGYNVDKDLRIEKVKTKLLQTTGTKEKDDIGYRLLSEDISAPKPVAEVPQKEPVKPAPQGGKESTYYKRAKEKIELELQEDVRYTPTTRKAEADSAVKLIQEDPEKALRIAKGFEDSSDVTSNSLRIALREKALIDGDKKMAAQLEKITSLESTRAGQEISMLRGALNDHDPMALVRSVIRQRLANAKLPAFDSVKQLVKRVGGKGRSKSAKLDTISDLAEQQQKRIQKKRMALKEVQSFIDEITCK